MAQQPPSLNLSWLGGAVGGALRPGRAENTGGSAFGGKRTLMKDIGEGIGSATDEQFAADAKKAKSLRSLFKLYGADLGLPGAGDGAETMGLEQLEGTLKGFIMEQGMKEQKQKEQAQNVNNALNQIQALVMAGSANRQNAAAADEQAGQGALGRGLAALANPPPESLRENGWNERQAFLQAAGPDLGRAVGATGASRVLDTVLGGGMGGGMAATPPQLFEVGGAKGAWSPQTGKWDWIPGQIPGSTAGAQVDPFDRMDYQALNRSLATLEDEFSKLPASVSSNLDRRNEIVGQMNRIKQRMQRIRGGGAMAPAAAPAASGGGATHRFDPATGTVVPVN